MIELYNADCYAKLKEIPDNSVDLVIIDPPYDILDCGGGGCFGSDAREYNNELHNGGLTKGVDVAWDWDWLQRAYEQAPSPIAIYTSNITNIYNDVHPDSITNMHKRGEITEYR